MRKAPHYRGETLLSQRFLCLNFHPTRQPEHDPVLAVHRHAFDQPGPLARVEFGVKLRQRGDGFDEPLDLPAPDHDLVDLLHHFVTPTLGFFVPADQRIVALVVLFLVLRHPCVLGDQVIDGLGVDAELLIQ